MRNRLTNKTNTPYANTLNYYGLNKMDVQKLITDEILYNVGDSPFNLVSSPLGCGDFRTYLCKILLSLTDYTHRN